MIFKRNVTSRLLLIRATFPLMFLAVLWLSPQPDWFILGLFSLSFLDFLGGIIQFVWQPNLFDDRFAVARDVIYALSYYIFFVHNPQISALMVFPSVLAELFVVFDYRVFFRAVIVEIALLIIRMATIYSFYHQLHPTWAILICTASVVMGLLGLEIARLEELQVNIVRQQRELKETLTAMLTTTLANSGIDEGVLHQENISLMLEDICQDANQSKGREIGQRLAQVIAIKQAAAGLLTSRELEVLVLASENHSYGKIAKHLQVSEGTVRAHAASIMRKAEVHSRNEMVLWAYKNRILPITTLQNYTVKTSEALHS